MNTLEVVYGYFKPLSILGAILGHPHLTPPVPPRDLEFRDIRDGMVYNTDLGIRCCPCTCLGTFKPPHQLVSHWSFLFLSNQKSGTIIWNYSYSIQKS